MKFYLGAHHPNWLRFAEFPLFVSHRRLRDYRTLPVARTNWALDSGGFSELTINGAWETTPAEYIVAVKRYRSDIGKLDWAAPQDWMCEPIMLAKTGFTVAEHQARTVDNFIELRRSIPVIPVLQGWSLEDYFDCIRLYAASGVQLRRYNVVGVGSVCRRQSAIEAAEIFGALADYGLRLHGFGVKITGLARFGDRLVSSDSMSWSYHGRREPPMPGHTHKNCANCFEFAARWRDKVVAA